MNSKQKVGYMALGAAILAIGIVIGQFITPDITAQNNGVLDEIRCAGLTVVDEAGNTAIQLTALKGDKRDFNSIRIYNRGQPSVELSSGITENRVMLVDKAGKGRILMTTRERAGNTISITDRAGNETWKAP